MPRTLAASKNISIFLLFVLTVVSEQSILNIFKALYHHYHHIALSSSKNFSIGAYEVACRCSPRSLAVWLRTGSRGLFMPFFKI
jgi:hypothetical protein